MEFRGYELETKQEIKECIYGTLVNKLCKSFINCKSNNDIHGAKTISEKVTYILDRYNIKKEFVIYTKEFLYEIKMFKYNLEF